MVKGISRQVIVLDTPDPKLFEQAIFILKDDLEGVTDEALLREARQMIRGQDKGGRKRYIRFYGVFWAAAGAFLTGLAWILTVWL